MFGFQVRKSNNNKKLITPVDQFSHHDSSKKTITPEESFNEMMKDAKVADDMRLINELRELAMVEVAEEAVEEIVNSSIVTSDNNEPVSLSAQTTEEYQEEAKDVFGEIYNLIDFQDKGDEIFKEWYVDGKLYACFKREGGEFKKIIIARPGEIFKHIEPFDYENPTAERKTTYIYNKEGRSFKDYFQHGFNNNTVTNMMLNLIKNCRNQQDERSEFFLFEGDEVVEIRTPGQEPPLRKALEPVMDMMIVERTIVGSRISRAPLNRTFSVNVGTFTGDKAEKYKKEVVQNLKGDIEYNPADGITKAKEFTVGQRDLFLTKNGAGQGVDFKLEQPPRNEPSIEDIDVLRTKREVALMVPRNRLDSGNSMIRTFEVTRQEARFNRYIRKLRNQFSNIFIQLIMYHFKDLNIEIKKNDIKVMYEEDSFFVEKQQLEILQERIRIIKEMGNIDGINRYWSDDYIKTRILKQSVEEQENLQKERKNGKTEQFNP